MVDNFEESNSSQAFTIRVYASGLERFTMGIVEENVDAMQFLM